jgi:hypothetical protein
MKVTMMVYEAILLAGCLRALSIAYCASAKEGIEEDRARVVMIEEVDYTVETQKAGQRFHSDTNV